jgi:hypothetical protein
MHALVARSTCGNEYVKNASGSEHIWQLSRWKSARRCGAKRISKSKRKPFSERFWKLSCSKSARSSGAKQISKLKCAKHTTFGACLEVEMWKKCMQLWHEAHVEVKMCKAHHAIVAQSAFRSQK